jgi:ribosomal protein L34E
MPKYRETCRSVERRAQVYPGNKRAGAGSFSDVQGRTRRLSREPGAQSREPEAEDRHAICLCANTGARLHRVQPLGIALDQARMRRARRDYRRVERPIGLAIGLTMAASALHPRLTKPSPAATQSDGPIAGVGGRQDAAAARPHRAGRRGRSEARERIHCHDFRGNRLGDVRRHPGAVTCRSRANPPCPRIRFPTR